MTYRTVSASIEFTLQVVNEVVRRCDRCKRFISPVVFVTNSPRWWEEENPAECKRCQRQRRMTIAARPIKDLRKLFRECERVFSEPKFPPLPWYVSVDRQTYQEKPRRFIP